MQTAEFDELAGRIEGIGRALMNLVTHLEEQGSLDGTDYTDTLRSSIPEPASALLSAAGRTMQEVADAIDAARTYRQSPVR